MSKNLLKKLAFKEGIDYSILNRIPIEKMKSTNIHNSD